MKKKRQVIIINIFVGFILIFIILSCQHNEKISSKDHSSETVFRFKNDWDTITVIVTKIDSLKKIYFIGNELIIEDFNDTILNSIEYINSYKDIKGNYLFVKSYKIDSLLNCFFNELNLKYPLDINSDKIDSIEKYNNKPLPRKFIHDIYNPNKDSCINFKSETINLDDENGFEKIFQFHYSDFFCVAILDNIDGKWFYKSRLTFGIHSSFPEIKFLSSKYKIIYFDYEAGWGTGYYSQYNAFYRYIDGKSYECIDFPNAEGSYYKPFTIWGNLSSIFTIQSIDSIKIDYTYNLFSFRQNKIQKPEEYILKGKKESVYYKWNIKKKKYEIYNASNKALINPKWFSILTFEEMYHSEIDSIEKFGTTKQKEVFLKEE